VEMGFPSEIPPEYVLAFADDEYRSPTEGVYPYTPVEIVAMMLEFFGEPNGMARLHSHLYGGSMRAIPPVYEKSRDIEVL
jgi:hypothetical protein